MWPETPRNTEMSVRSSILVSTEIRRDQKSSTYFFYKFKCCCVLSICKYVCGSSLSPLIQVILGNTGAGLLFVRLCWGSDILENGPARVRAERTQPVLEFCYYVAPGPASPGLGTSGPGPPRNLQPVTELRPDLDTAGAARGTGNRL